MTMKKESTLGNSSTDPLPGVPLKRRRPPLIYIAGLLLSVIVGILIGVITIILLHKGNTAREFPQVFSEKTPFNFEDIFSQDFTLRQFIGFWVGDGNVFVYNNEFLEVMEYNADTNKTTKIMDNATLVELQSPLFYVSNTREFVLIAYDVRTLDKTKVALRSKIYDRSTKEVLDFPNGDRMRGKEIMAAQWAPTGNGIIFVYQYNLYYQISPRSTPMQLTTDGERHKIHNGVGNFNYNGVIGDSGYIAMSSKLKYIAYVKINSTATPVYNMTYYGETSDVYPSTEEFTYMKAGETRRDANPTGQVFVVDMENPTAKHKLVRFPAEEFPHTDHYVQSMVWQESAKDSHLAVVWVNRVQDQAVVSICKDISFTCYVNYRLKIDGGWLEMTTPQFIQNFTYILVLPREGANGLIPQVARVNGLSHGTDVVYLTTGVAEVKRIVGYDPEAKLVYFTMHMDDRDNADSRQLHLYRVGTPDADPGLREVVCISCDDASGCQYVDADFSSTGKYYVANCLGPFVPTYRLIGIDKETDIVLEDNSKVRNNFMQKAMPTRQLNAIGVGGGYAAWMDLMLPPNFDRSKKYPLLVYTYAGPASQNVLSAFSPVNNQQKWAAYLSSSHDVVVAQFDGRGSGGDGNKRKFELHHRLGTVEVEDQIIATENILKTLPYLDSKKTAIWGWSYGGFTTSHALANESDVFKCGLAVAPVINYDYYYSGYTERYMGLVKDNEQAYNDTDVTRKVKYLKNKKYFIAHGTRDENVHYQHSAQMFKIQFDSMVFTDEDHSIGSPHAIRHLYRTMSSFLLDKCYNKLT